MALSIPVGFAIAARIEGFTAGIATVGFVGEVACAAGNRIVGGAVWTAGFS